MSSPPDQVMANFAGLLYDLRQRSHLSGRTVDESKAVAWEFVFLSSLRSDADLYERTGDPSMYGLFFS
jgi:hypothetical protein